MISAETIEYHYGKHHQAYVNNLNNLVPGTKYEKMSLEEIVKATNGQASEKKVFNNAAQVWNHTFFWNCLAPKAGGDPTGAIKAAIDKSFGSFADFKKKFSDAAAAQFGSGWAWLVKNADGSLAIETTVERRDAVRRRQDVRAHARRLGARLLHRLPQRAPEVHRGVLEARRTGTSRTRTSASCRSFPLRKCRSCSRRP